MVSDEEGFFRIDISGSGRVDLEVIHPDFLEQEITLTDSALSAMVIIRLTPYIKQREEIVVTALRYPEPSVKVPAAETVVDSESFAGGAAANLTQGLTEVPGFAALGSGGFSLVPSIRGLARNRILLIVDRTRISSDRRTGPSASFVDPEDIDKVEVLRSPSSVFYGSEAIGGVVQIFTKTAEPGSGLHGRANLSYGSVNQEKTAGLSLSQGWKNTGFTCLGRGQMLRIIPRRSGRSLSPGSGKPASLPISIIEPRKERSRPAFC